MALVLSALMGMPSVQESLPWEGVLVLFSACWALVSDNVRLIHDVGGCFSQKECFQSACCCTNPGGADVKRRSHE